MDATLREPDTHRDAELRALVSQMRGELRQLRREVSELRCEAGYWKSRHADAVERNKKLHEELDQAHADIRRLKADLFGRKSEKQSSTDRSNHLDDPQDPSSANKKKRGQQSNRPGPARRDYSHLPVREQLVELPPEACVCGRCGKPLADGGEAEDSEQVEVELSVYRRRIRRRRYRKTCHCPGPPTLTAPKLPKLIPKGRYGISLWVFAGEDSVVYLLDPHRERRQHPSSSPEYAQVDATLRQHVAAMSQRRDCGSGGIWNPAPPREAKRPATSGLSCLGTSRTNVAPL